MGHLGEESRNAGVRMDDSGRTTDRKAVVFSLPENRQAHMEDDPQRPVSAHNVD